MELNYTVKPSLGQKLRPWLQNWRLMSFVGFFVLLFGSLGYGIFRDVLSLGVVFKGNVAVVNLKALGNFPFDDQNGLPSDVPGQYRALDGKKVELEGFLFTGKSAGRDVASCQLVWNIQKCCFGGPPRVQERVFLNARADKNFTLYDPSTLVKVTGTLQVKLNKNNDGTVTEVYEMVPDEISPQS
jgi:hypothetical protein